MGFKGEGELVFTDKGEEIAVCGPQDDESMLRATRDDVIMALDNGGRRDDGDEARLWGGSMRRRRRHGKRCGRMRADGGFGGGGSKRLSSISSTGSSRRGRGRLIDGDNDSKGALLSTRGKVAKEVLNGD